MSRRGLRIAIAMALASVSAAPAMAQYVVNLREADIRAFIEDAARVTGRTIIVDQGVQGKVSVVTQRPLSRSEYFELFLSTLRANGLVAVPAQGGALRVQPVASAATTASRVGRAPSPNSFVTEIFRLRNIDAASAVDSVRPLVSREGSVTANRNSLIVADFADNIGRIRQILSSIDRDSSSTQLVALENAGAREIAEALTALVGGGGEGRAAAVSVVPVDSSNSIALRGDPAAVARLAEVARDLDRRAASGTEIRVVFLEHADAAQLLPVLQTLLGQPAQQAAPQQRTIRTQTGNRTVAEPTAISATPAAAPAATGATTGGNGVGAFGNKSAIVTRFEGANAIVIAAPIDVQRQLGEVIRQLDTRREQVLVEAIIVEIADNAAKQLGVQLLLAGLKGSNIPFAVTNYSNASPNIATIAGAIAAERLRTTTTTVNGQVVTTTQNSSLADTLQQAAAQQLLGANAGLAGIGFRSGNAIFGAIVNAVKSDNKSNILSTPSIMTLDNREARILVGQEIPITTGEALSDNFDNAFRTVQRQNVGISLEVKPQINAGGTIKLDLRQEVSSIAGPVSSDFSDLILNKREIETTITVDDGDIVGIGGLLDDNERRTIEKIPLLGDIPLLGALFQSKGRARAKTNLMVFIRPTILRSAEDARRMTDRRYGYIRGMQFLQDPNQEPSIDELVRDYMGAVPPGSSSYDPAGTLQPAIAPVAPQAGDQVVTPVMPQVGDPQP
ncbi:type II secretion system secretin GspD [Allosphingosinicella indica]|uniref:General secretion pathway protein D n=1 Tax=Allosphingosinicella indica TaxID=941907 RepID=A0A1X7H2Z8_9SPHN|nr:type II secretion system secretin GspD [Allosphingosinicella indica]SMF78015.1 general secretion pathway protein D [Allosphingosinicella indica]